MWIVEENHVSTSNKFFYLWILPVQSRQTCVNRQWQSYDNLFRHLKHNLEEKEKDDVMS